MGLKQKGRNKNQRVNYWNKNQRYLAYNIEVIKNFDR